MRSGKAGAGQARQIGDEGRRGDAAAQIVGGDGEGKQPGELSGERQQGEQQVRCRRQDGAREQHAHDAVAGDHEPPDEAAENRHDQTESPRNASDLLFFEAEIDIEHIGHHPHHHIGDTVGRDQRQDEQGGVAEPAEEIREGHDIGLARHLARHQPGPHEGQPRQHGAGRGGQKPHRLDGQPGQRPRRLAARQRRLSCRGGVRAQREDNEEHAGRRGEGRQKPAVIGDRPDSAAGLGVALGLADQQGGHDAEPHYRRHRQPGGGPGRELIARGIWVERAGEFQRAGAGDDHAHPVAGDIGRGHQALHVDGRRFDAERIDDNVLGGRGEGKHHREGRRRG